MIKRIQQFVHRFGKPVKDWYAEFRILLNRSSRLWTEYLSNISKVFLVTGLVGPFTDKIGVFSGAMFFALGFATFYVVLKYGKNDED